MFLEEYLNSPAVWPCHYQSDGQLRWSIWHNEALNWASLATFPRIQQLLPCGWGMEAGQRSGFPATGVSLLVSSLNAIAAEDQMTTLTY